MPSLRLYAFHFRDPIGGKLMRARHVLGYPTLTRRYLEFEVTGPAEIRSVPEDWQQLTAGNMARGAHGAEAQSR